jgi:hypothetical protein
MFIENYAVMQMVGVVERVLTLPMTALMVRRRRRGNVPGEVQVISELAAEATDRTTLKMYRL